MGIPLEARLVDVINLIIAKGANFLLTASIFALASRNMDSHGFGEFGYWWSIAIMIGGVLLGGLSSALVRTAAVHGSLGHLAAPLRFVGFGLLLLVLAWWTLLLVMPTHTELILLLAAIAVFGLALQTQTAVLALLRAAEATRANIIASLLIVLLIPLVVYLLLDLSSNLVWVFYSLAFAFVIGTFASIVSSRRQLRHLFVFSRTSGATVATFLANTFSFTAINFFAYVVVNVDFTLFRIIGTADEFAVMATGKVFFERFALPFLLVFAGAVSLRVLRQPHSVGGPQAWIKVGAGYVVWVSAFGTVLMLALAYWTFAIIIRGDSRSIPLPWVLCASFGYVLYAFNGILLDILVVRRKLAAVVAHMAVFILLGSVLQAIAIANFGLLGWALGWLLFNLLVTVILARDGLSVLVPGRS